MPEIEKKLAKFCMLLLVSFFGNAYAGCSKGGGSSPDPVEPLAFPGAEGYGKFTIGGRGGAVLEVTNLNDAGPGSLRAAVEAEGPRTVIFRVSGTIALSKVLRIRNPYITIAGQTAPGDGICIRNYPLQIDAGQVIVRYLRVRMGDESGGEADAVSSRFNNNIIIDHVSASWSVDETLSIYHGDSITVQWCIVSESLYKSNHAKGSHGFGGIWGSNHSSYHHNLIAHHSSRNPRFASGSQYTDFRNNVIYNWGYNSMYGGEKVQQDDNRFGATYINIVDNYFKPGPATKPGEVSHRIVSPSTRNGLYDYGRWHVSGNFMEGNEQVTKNNWSGGVQPQGGSSVLPSIKAEEAWPSMEIEQQTAAGAFDVVLEQAGAILPRRDAVDTRVVKETRSGYATHEGATYKINNSLKDKSKICGIIDSQKEVGGWPLLITLPVPLDTDRDGMPDEWEKARGLDPKNPADRNKLAHDGYTMLEQYINSIQ